MGTATLTILFAAWVAIAASLGAQLIRPRPASPGSRRFLAGLLIIMSAAAASQFAHNRN